MSTRTPARPPSPVPRSKGVQRCSSQLAFAVPISLTSRSLPLAVLTGARCCADPLARRAHTAASGGIAHASWLGELQGITPPALGQFPGQQYASGVTGHGPFSMDPQPAPPHFLQRLSQHHLRAESVRPTAHMPRPHVSCTCRKRAGESASAKVNTMCCRFCGRAYYITTLRHGILQNPLGGSFLIANPVSGRQQSPPTVCVNVRKSHKTLS